MTNVFQSLLLVIAGATQKELARQLKYLKVENQVLRSKLPQHIKPAVGPSFWIFCNSARTS